MSRIVIALGGNALGNDYLTQQIKIKETLKKIIPFIKDNHEIILTHGNGPQVGIINLAFENSATNEEIPYMPLDACTAMSQGYIGYHIQKECREVLIENNINKNVVTVITQVLVDENDPSFKNPTKPIGLFYSKEEAEKISSDKKTIFIEDSNRGYRKVVASPKPLDIIEIESIKDLISKNNLVIACGGGGIPIVKDFKTTEVNAVIDKDLASSKLALMLDADYLIILTTLNHASLNYGKENEQKLGKITCAEAKKYLEEGHFAKGSMYPKIEAAIEFSSVKNNISIITSIDNIENALNEINCTIIKD